MIPSTTETTLVKASGTGTTDLSFFNQAIAALAEAETLDDVKQLHDQAEAFRVYARSAMKGLELQNQAAEIKLRAERKAGQLLAESKLRGGDRRSKFPNGTLKLSKLGITRKQSYRWQLEASVPDSQFEAYVRNCVKNKREMTSAAVIRLAEQPAKQDTEQPWEGLSNTRAGLDFLVSSGERFACIYAAPPWPDVEDQTTPRSSSSSSKAASFGRQLSELPLRQLSAAMSHLHLRTPSDRLDTALRTLAGWGFEYKSTLVLPVQSHCYGPFWQPTCEFVLLGVRGDLAFRDTSVKGLMDKRTTEEENSRQKLLERIVRVSPGPYMDVFADAPVPGWTSGSAKSI